MIRFTYTLIGAIALCVLLAARASATVYYVDCQYGNDSNTTNAAVPGAAGTGPWATANKVSQMSTNLNPGDVVAFASGPNEVCRPSNGQFSWLLQLGHGGGAALGSAQNPIYITNYGSGALPVMDGAECLGAQTGNCTAGPIISGGWSLLSGNIWQKTYTHQPYQVYLDNDAAWGLTAASCTTGTCARAARASITVMQPGSWFWANNVLSIWTPQGDSPANHVVEASVLPAVVFVNATGSEHNFETYDRLEIRHGCIGFQAFTASSGGNFQGIVLRNSFITQQGTGRVDAGDACNNTYFNQTTQSASAPSIVSNRASYATHGNITMQCANGAIFKGNDVSYGNHGGIDIPSVSNACPPVGTQIIGNYVHDMGLPEFHVGTPTGIYVENEDATTVIANNVCYNLSDLSGAAALGSRFVDGCISLFSPAGGTVMNNISVGANVGFQEFNTAANLVVKNNTFSVTPGPFNYAISLESTCTNCKFDGNNLHAGAQTNVAWNVGTAQTFAAWQAAGNDPNGKSVDAVNTLPPGFFTTLKLLENRITDVATSSGTGTGSGGSGSGLSTCRGGPTTLSAPTITVSAACIQATSFPVCVDNTEFASVSCTPSSGSMTISAPIGDSVSWIIVG